ncbi:hypothetical protein C1645_820071 [Glomus cerebriforme]|uniref:F-box domain-containing protein n=1 Tax=Glomus cerebriforme TaxID=658196 RepID=A0A397T3A4_9GLOM|nr:hypothetical protein C1645_820071 [Glomus cerebriforme]
MSKINRDILYLIFEEFYDDKKSLSSFLLVNKTWCEIILPILWKNPWKDLTREKEKLLLYVIISHLSDENKFKQTIDFLKNSYQRPLFNYISFCRHLNFNVIKRIISTHYFLYYAEIINDIHDLFINGNTKFTHLYMFSQFDCELHLIPGAKQRFSEIEFLSIDTGINENILVGLAGMCKSIKKLELFINSNNDSGIVELIKSQKKLINVSLLSHGDTESFEISYKIIENSLINHANTIQYFKLHQQPLTSILSSFINLKSLELGHDSYETSWSCVESLTLPLLQTLKVKCIPFKALTSLIENTGDHLTEIKIYYKNHYDINNVRIIQTIYQNCPKLKYLKLFIDNSLILELEKLLLNCQYLNGLSIILDYDNTIDWIVLFQTLAKLSPVNLFEFKFCSDHFNYLRAPKIESLKLFFDNWKGRHPLILRFNNSNMSKNYFDLIEKYKAEGIIKTFEYDCFFKY